MLLSFLQAILLSKAIGLLENFHFREKNDETGISLKIEMEKIEAGRGSICGWRETHERYCLAGSGMFEKLYMSRVRQKNMEFFQSSRGGFFIYRHRFFHLFPPKNSFMVSVTCCRFDSDSPET